MYPCMSLRRRLFSSSARSCTAFACPAPFFPLCARLPCRDEVELVKQIDDVECEIVAYLVRYPQLQEKRERYHRPHGPFPCREKSGYHRHGVRYGIDDTVAGVSLRERLLAIMLDDRRCVFRYLPGNLYSHCHEKPRPHRYSRKQKCKERIKKNAVNDMRKGVPISQVL